MTTMKERGKTAEVVLCVAVSRSCGTKNEEIILNCSEKKERKLFISEGCRIQFRMFALSIRFCFYGAKDKDESREFALVGAFSRLTGDCV